MKTADEVREFVSDLRKIRPTSDSAENSMASAIAALCWVLGEEK